MNTDPDYIYESGFADGASRPNQLFVIGFVIGLLCGLFIGWMFL